MGTRKLYQHKCFGCGKVTFPQGMAGICKADDLISADPVILSFFFKCSFIFERETEHKSGIGVEREREGDRGSEGGSALTQETQMSRSNSRMVSS